jgi:hypothetical protein
MARVLESTAFIGRDCALFEKEFAAVAGPPERSRPGALRWRCAPAASGRAAKWSRWRSVVATAEPSCSTRAPGLGRHRPRHLTMDWRLRRFARAESRASISGHPRTWAISYRRHGRVLEERPRPQRKSRGAGTWAIPRSSFCGQEPPFAATGAVTSNDAGLQGASDARTGAARCDSLVVGTNELDTLGGHLRVKLHHLDQWTRSHGAERGLDGVPGVVVERAEARSAGLFTIARKGWRRPAGAPEGEASPARPLSPPLHLQPAMAARWTARRSAVSEPQPRGPVPAHPDWPGEGGARRLGSATLTRRPLRAGATA